MTLAPDTPLLAVHGFADSARTWDPVRPRLAAIAAVHAPDLPGHGDRVLAPGEQTTRDGVVGELVAVIEDIGGPVTVVGHSLGGYLALVLALTRPDLVASLVLVSTGPGFRREQARAEWNDYLRDLAQRNDMPAGVVGQALQPDVFVMEHLGELRAPLVHVVGERDSRYLAGAAHLQKVLPASELVQVPGAGHHPQRSHPQVVAEAVLRSRA